MQGQRSDIHCSTACSAADMLRLAGTPEPKSVLQGCVSNPATNQCRKHIICQACNAGTATTSKKPGAGQIWVALCRARASQAAQKRNACNQHAVLPSRGCSLPPILPNSCAAWRQHVTGRTRDLNAGCSQSTRGKRNAGNFYCDARSSKPWRP